MQQYHKKFVYILVVAIVIVNVFQLYIAISLSFQCNIFRRSKKKAICKWSEPRKGHFKVFCQWYHYSIEKYKKSSNKKVIINNSNKNK